MRHGLAIAVVAFLALSDVKTAVGDSAPMFKVWKQAYTELHPGEQPPWHRQAEARTWIKQNWTRIEPSALAILRGERPGVPWTDGLLLAQEMPTPPICNVLLEHARRTMEWKNTEQAKSKVDENGDVLGSLIAILGQAHDERVRPLAERILMRDGAPNLLVERCLVALQRTGTCNSLGAIRSVSGRSENRRLKRLCALTEKIVKARVEGQPVCAHPQKELIALGRAYVQTIKSGDYREYIRLLIYGYAEVLTEPEVRREVFNNKNVQSAVEELDGTIAGGAQFQLGEEDLRATLDFGGKYRLVCVYEVDGWKVASLTQTGP